MILDQIAQRTGSLVVAGAGPDPEVLGNCDLDVVDEVAIPDGLEQRIREPQRDQVLDRLLAQVVIYPEHLRLVEHSQYLRVQLPRRSQVVAERLLDHDPGLRPLAAVESRSPELARDQREELRRGRQVEHAVQRATGPLV